MPEHTITHCVVEDGPAMAKNNFSAFWEDPNWSYIWKDTTLEDIIRLGADRYPRQLIQNRDTLRHTKVVDSETGALLGYARWKLPEKYTKHEDGSPVWPEGQVPDVSDEQKDEIEKRASIAQEQWKPSEFTGEDDLDAILKETEEAILAKKDYLKLDYITVHPSNQKKGVGLALVKHGIEQARSLGLDIFLLACSGGFRMYEKAGFKEVDRIIQDATRIGGTNHYEVRFMVYEVANS
ncbi:hypothetical protein PMIN06_010782 [Paraphaeosphaeria minitans]|uniref:Acetyltransferase n=1 Tax=Paraphaeosphaeria minitans TaxID=565426 RepID=A0A9P6G9W3_9PLEO|nr:acetyltransferase [Paraphaeosphaeria minitans]